MLLKLALDPVSLGLASAIGSFGLKKVIPIAVSNQLHDVPHFISAKSNKLGKFIQRSTLADSIIATKKGTEGKIWANRKLLPSLFFSGQEGKSIAALETNKVAANIPKAKSFFKGNKLQVGRVKGALRTARVIDRTALAGQVAAPTYLGYRDFKHEYEKSGDVKKATKRGLVGAATGGLIAGGLEIPRRIAGQASSLHKALKRNNNYGYGLLEEASRSAEKSMNRPGFLNYSKHFYATPEDNLKSPTGRILGDNLNRLMGQSKVKKYDKIKGYMYVNEDTDQGMMSKFLDRADVVKHKVTNMVTK